MRQQRQGNPRTMRRVVVFIIFFEQLNGPRAE